SALRGILEGLLPDDRVQVYAVDVNTTPQHEAFAPAQSASVQGAISKLQARTPLGSTDLVRALMTAADAFPDDPTRARHVIYLGDGQSRAKIVGQAEMEMLVTKLRDKQVSVSSLAIGPQRNALLLAA